jgi:hypothetical protein
VIRLSLYVKEVAWVLYGFHTILCRQSVTGITCHAAKLVLVTAGAAAILPVGDRSARQVGVREAMRLAPQAEHSHRVPLSQSEESYASGQK